MGKGNLREQPTTLESRRLTVQNELSRPQYFGLGRNYRGFRLAPKGQDGDTKVFTSWDHQVIERLMNYGDDTESNKLITITGGPMSSAAQPGDEAGADIDRFHVFNTENSA
jgi:hypothetical protein